MGVRKPPPGVVGLGLLTALAASCDHRPSWAGERLGRAYFDSTGSYHNAGVSTRIRVQLPPLEISSLDGDTTGRAFGLFRTRCAGCHQVPAPDMKTGQQWPYLVRRMKERSESAGLIPMSDGEADTILVFLREHAKP